MSGFKRTPLFPLYQKYGAKTIGFGGWELPVQFASILEEHEAVRTRAGLFDVSHMGEIKVTGKDALGLIQYLLTNDVSGLKPGQALYSPMCYPDGGTVDDLLVYCLGEQEYLLVVNAANTDKDFVWIQQHADGAVKVENISDQISQLALQGPRAEPILQKLTQTDLQGIGAFRFKPYVDLQGITALVSRTGYTGEDGFEIYCSPDDAPDLWEKILEAGQDEGILPCGLGARDTLRFEAKLPLYGQELAADITPIEAGLGFAVKVDKESDFIGKEILKQQKEEGPPRKLVGIEMTDRGIPRNGYPVLVNGEEAGFVTTGTFSPTLKKNLGLALLKSQYARLDQEVEVMIRGKPLKAKVVKTPFYRRPKN